MASEHRVERTIYDPVWARLTSDGEATYQEYLKSIGQMPHPSEKDALGYTMFSIRQLMIVFGNKLLPENEDQFVDCILHFSQPVIW